jgi:hypothetical protein
MSDATPIVSDQEMLRAYAETIRLKDAEIERLKSLLVRAADALEWPLERPGALSQSGFRALIAELREGGKSEH